MRNIAIVILAVLVSGAALWYMQGNRRDTTASGRTIAGNVVINGAGQMADVNGLRNGAFAVEGNLHMRPLPNGEVVLEGDLRVSAAKPD